MRKGSITIFASLSLMLVASVLLVLAEGARVRSGEVLAEQNTEAVVESLFSQYEIPLWENYHLLARYIPVQEGNLALSGLEIEGEQLTQANANPEGTLFWKNHFMRMEQTQMVFSSYTLLTDDNGKAFQAAVSSYLKENLLTSLLEQPDSAFQELLQKDSDNKDSNNKDSSEIGTNSLDSIDKALDSIEEEKKKAQEENSSENTSGGSGTSFGESNSQKKKIKENPLEVVKEFQSKGILSLVLEDTSQLSEENIDLDCAVSHRTLIQGVNPVQYESSWYDPVLMQQYYKMVFSDFMSEEEGKSLSYEMEYLLCGKESDVENLKAVVYRLLAVREVANLVTLATDSARQSEALTIATAIGGFTGNPAVIEVVRVGILAAWAFVESILDIRSLLQGEKIPLIKSQDQWTSDIWGLSNSTGNYAKAKKCSTGLSYSQYLQNLLYLQNSATTAYRAMDLQEMAIRQMEGYEDFRMDQAIIAMEVEMGYEIEPMFLTNVTIGNVSLQPFSLQTSCKYSYLKAGV